MAHGVTPSAPPILPSTLDGLLGPVENLERDERLLDDGEASVRVGLLRGPSLSYGVGVPSSSDFVVRAQAEGLPTVRRRSGGSGLVHEDGDLAWAVVLARSDPRVGRDFVRAYARWGRGVVAFLEGLGLSGTWTASPGACAEYCTLSRRGEVLFANGRILGGAAQHATRSAVLHHGTISVGLDRARIARLFALPEGGALSRLTGLRELGITEPSPALAERLARAVAAGFS